jgi:hypothetical protein
LRVAACHRLPPTPSRLHSRCRRRRCMTATTRRSTSAARRVRRRCLRTPRPSRWA